MAAATTWGAFHGQLGDVRQSLANHVAAIGGWLLQPFVPTPDLWVAAEGGDAEEVRRLITGGADIEVMGGPFRSSPLLRAAITGQEAVVLLLLELGADISAKNMVGFTPLAAAASNNEETIVQLLLQHGADVSVKTILGFTPLADAAMRGHEAVALLLVQHGADVSATDIMGETALHAAASEGREQMVLMLIEHGADVSSTNNFGDTPQDLATSHSHLKVAAILKAEAVSRAKRVAFAMGLQGRLGAGSWVHALDAEMVRKVLERV